jgi:hypothetical protein
VSATELADALSASRSRAIAALGKAYVRREEPPDDDLFRQLMHGIGLDDDVAISFLLHAWAILREQRADPPTETQPAKQDEPASESQLRYLHVLADGKGIALPARPWTKARASQAIEQLKAGTFKPDEWEVPF